MAETGWRAGLDGRPDPSLAALGRERRPLWAPVHLTCAARSGRAGARACSRWRPGSGCAGTTSSTAPSRARPGTALRCAGSRSSGRARSSAGRARSPGRRRHRPAQARHAPGRRRPPVPRRLGQAGQLSGAGLAHLGPARGPGAREPAPVPSRGVGGRPGPPRPGRRARGGPPRPGGDGHRTSAPHSQPNCPSSAGDRSRTG
jgi:hypothetical protein